MNLHPVVVHFPIAFLTLYSIIRILPLPKWLPTYHWESIQKILIFIGFLSAIAAIYTGEMAEIHGNGKLLEMHEFFGETTRNMYGILFILSFSEEIHKISSKFKLEILNPITKTLIDLNNTRWFIVILTTLSLVLLTLTGLIGGYMVHGPVDPLSNIIIPLLLQ